MWWYTTIVVEDRGIHNIKIIISQGYARKVPWGSGAQLYISLTFHTFQTLDKRVHGTVGHNYGRQPNEFCTTWWDHIMCYIIDQRDHPLCNDWLLKIINKMSLIKFNLIKLIMSSFSPFQRSVPHVSSYIISCLGISKCNTYFFIKFHTSLTVYILCKYEQFTINAPIF